MKIIQVVTQLEAGGAQNAAVALARELRRRGHEVETWFLYIKHHAFEGEPHVRIFRDAHPGAVGLWSLFPELCSALKRARPATVIGYTHYASILIGLAGLVARVPIRIASIREPVSGYPKGARILDRLLGSLGVYTSIVAVSASAAESCSEYPEAYRRRIRVIRNGALFQPSFPSKADARRALGVSERARLLLNVGRLATVKNQGFLISLLPHLPKWELVLVGEGPSRAMLLDEAARLGVSDRLKLVGQVGRDTVNAYLAAADVFLFSSTHEGFGFAVLEALSAGLPVIAHDIPSVREMLHDDDLRPVGAVLPLDVEAWVEAVNELDRDRAFANDRGTRSRARASDFSFDVMTDEYLKLAGELNDHHSVSHDG